MNVWESVGVTGPIVAGLTAIVIHEIEVAKALLSKVPLLVVSVLGT